MNYPWLIPPLSPLVLTVLDIGRAGQGISATGGGQQSYSSTFSGRCSIWVTARAEGDESTSMEGRAGLTDSANASVDSW